MKLLTLNTHSIIENDYQQKLKLFVDAIADMRPEIIALQEVNQSAVSPVVDALSELYYPCRNDVILREDNHALNVVRLLHDMSVRYYWTWLPVKKGYDRFDEGLALLSSSPIVDTDVLCVSSNDGYDNWRTRKLLGIRTDKYPDEWFFSVHFGRWDDIDEPFKPQWVRTAKYMTRYDNVWLMGDFNAPAEIDGESYSLIKRSYWHDSYELAEHRDDGITISGNIDGWHDNFADGLRIDHIWRNRSAVITDSQVVFNGKNRPVVSDHYGVLVNYERSIV